MNARGATYPLLAITFLAIALAVAAVALASVGHRRPALVRRWWLPTTIAFVVVAVLTAVFDSALIAVEVMRYDETLMSDIHLGLAPIEDFAYPLAVVLLVPSVWSLLSSSPLSREGRRR
ncbi:hypothetical protein GCM10027568_26500 [Humibacter soli]